MRCLQLCQAVRGGSFEMLKGNDRAVTSSCFSSNFRGRESVMTP